METEPTYAQTIEYKNQLKRLIGLKPNELVRQIPDNIADLIDFFVYVSTEPKDEINELLTTLNMIADLPDQADLLLPVVHVFLEHPREKCRVLTAVEATALHYQLLRPRNDLIDYNDFIDITYDLPTTNTIMLRLFLYWNGCFCLQHRIFDRAEYYFEQCCLTPTSAKKPSKVGMESAKKLSILQASRGVTQKIPSPYSLLLPSSYVSLCERASKRSLTDISRSIGEENEFKTDGNEGLVAYLYSQVQFLIIERIARAYSTIDMELLQTKSGLSKKEIKDVVVSAEREKGKDWMYDESNDVVYFGINHRLPKLDGYEFALKHNRELIVKACEYIDANKEERLAKKEEREKREKLEQKQRKERKEQK